MKLSKWKLFRRGILILSAFGFIGSVVLLLNITASNPTHRRYSSQVVPTSGGPAIGKPAETILSDDLGVPNNNDSDQRQCFCNKKNSLDLPSGCNICLAHLSLSNPNYDIPDFVTSFWIAESKNVANDSGLWSQISDYVQGALSIKRPLWVFTRVNTDISPELEKLVDDTGGAVVRYFAVSGYFDPVDMAAHNGLIASLGLLAVFGAWDVISRRGNSRNPVEPRIPNSSQPLATRRSDPISGLDNALQRAQDAARQTRDKLD